MRRLVLLAPVLVALVAGVAACSDATNGSPIPGGDSTQTETTTSPKSNRPTTTSNRPAGDSPLKDKDPCTLLTADGQAKLGVSNGEKRTVGQARTCRWRLRGPSETYIFDVGILDRIGLDDVPSTSNPKPLSNVGKHKAVQTTGGGGDGSCSVIMGVTDSSRVDTGVIAGTDTQKACDLAMQLAQLVEPELP